MESTGMDLEIFKAIFMVINAAISGGAWLYIYLINRNRVTNERIAKLQDDVDTRLDNHADRMARLESDIIHAPNHGHLGSVYDRVGAIDQRLARLEGEFKAQGDTLRLILNQITQKGMQ